MKAVIVRPFRVRGSDVFHTNTRCLAGKAIRATGRLDGGGKLDECNACRTMAGVPLAVGGGDESLARDLRVLAEVEILGGFGFFILRPASGEIFYSEGAYEIHGLEPEQALVPVGSMAGVVHPDDFPALKVGITAVAESGETYSSRHRVLRPDGEVRWVRVNAQRLGAGTDDPHDVLGTIVDVTDEMTT